VWFDRNHDGDRDAGEWPMPGVQVKLDSSAPASAAVTGIPRSPSVRGPAIRGIVAVVDTTTAADGTYAFTGLSLGSYTVTALLSAAGVSRTSDTDGAADWVVNVSVTGAAEVSASFAGVGKGALGGTVLSVGTQAPISGANVICRWAGFDDRPDTADDVVMTALADENGRFTLLEIPYGEYTCSARDPVTGALAAPVQATVMSAALVDVTLPIGQGSGPGVSEASLPKTGTPIVALTALGLLLLLAGAEAARQSRPRHR
jgi:hypothetical protein